MKTKTSTIVLGEFTEVRILVSRRTTDEESSEISVNSRGKWPEEVEPWEKGLAFTARNISFEGMVRFAEYLDEVIGKGVSDEVTKMLIDM